MGDRPRPRRSARPSARRRVRGLADLTSYLQRAAFPPALRRSLAATGIEPDELRRMSAEAAGVEPLELVKLRRVTWWSLVQAGLLVLATTTVLEALGYDVGLADLFLINISVSLLGSFVPIPGGIGVAEFGLTGD